MAHKATTQPKCLYCHKPIPKYTTHHYVEGAKFSFGKSPLVTLADLRKKTNEQIVSAKYHYEQEEHVPNEDYTHVKRRVSGRRTVYSYSTWDGESYIDPFFCNGEHARNFGYAAARHGLRFKK